MDSNANFGEKNLWNSIKFKENILTKNQRKDGKEEL